MRDLIEATVRQMLESYLDRIEELSAETEDLRRRMQSMVRLGYVESIHESGMLIKVRHGELTTPSIRWFAAAAGATTDYRCPSEGEQCVILNYGGGNAGAQTVALVGLFSDAFPAPTTETNLITRCYPDGSLVSYHTQDKVMTIKSVGELNIEVGASATIEVGETTELTAGGDVTVKSGANVLIEGSKIDLIGGAGVVTGAHKCMITGLPHADCSTLVNAAK
ncbi:phage baseplate assembly protein V [Marinomonas mediterranea]|jgi:phage baseplate assembly protein V|uniref:Phage baseplate assembly protein V n=1 Tax=Marinomonas mediterranea (strain ATCC 700492 / JCM 21426 / NBRC 103028 / MMB-1) TaxID=717774 RepID=F2K222_MARM1|nr:phage baseplate assembly protein V [Marinomonas mediterranea]ADZ91100.1 phage baseplate assembly protein V [Marinomonas mediterranea MMB-1]WCN13161.1 phage baseplate assembly protein V [Marinomonas mediterranea]WCN17232.1 phage baseplate assembly protein V [Marinomonas mediterranea MMB-1]